MLRKISLVAASLILLLFLNQWFSLTPYPIPFFSVPPGKARVDLINRSGKQIRSIQFVSGNSARTYEDISDGERTSVLFEQSSEGTYQFRVIFADGDSLISDEVYVEGGYFLEEFIDAKSIQTVF